MREWEQKILETFFDIEGVSMLLPYFCKHKQDRDKAEKTLDVISSTIVIFLTCPLHLTMNHYGASLFYGKSTMVYPYHLMTPRQKNALLDLVKANTEYNILNGSIAFRRSKEVVTAPIAATLQSLCAKIYASKKFVDKPTQTAICNIIMQRIQGYVPISMSVQREINQWLQRLY